MLRSEAIAEIQRGLGFRSDLVDEIILKLQEAQREFEIGATLPWFLRSEDQTIQTVASTRTIAFPDRFLRIVETEGPYYDSPDEGISYLSVRPYDEALLYYNEYNSGPPRALSVRSASFAVFPMPDAVYDITLSYYVSCTCLTTDLETGWLLHFPDYLLNRAGMHMAADLEHSISYQKFESKYLAWQKRYFAEIAAREDQAMPRMMGVNQ